MKQKYFTKEKKREAERKKYKKYSSSPKGRNRSRKRDKKRGSLITNKNISWFLMGHSLPYWKTKLKNKKYKNLTPEYMEELTIKQGGCCYYTGIPLRPFKFKKTKGVTKRPLALRLEQVSIDRLDPNKGYTKGNIVLASMTANKMKDQSNLNQFKALISLISKRHNIGDNFQTAELSNIIKKINKKYIKRTLKGLKKSKKLLAKRKIDLYKKFPKKLAMDKGNLKRTN